MSDERPFGDLPRGQYARNRGGSAVVVRVFSEEGKARSADRHYVTMAADAIEQLPVGELAACRRTLISLDHGPVPRAGNASPGHARWGFEPSSTGIRLDQAQP